MKHLLIAVLVLMVAALCWKNTSYAALGEKATAVREARNAAGGQSQNRETRRENEVDNREARQARRIEQGIKKGYLTADEVAKLQAQEDKIAKMEADFKADGKLTKDEFKQLNSALNDASREIWAEKHNSDGNQMPVYRLGKNIFAKADFTAKMGDENLPPAEAKALLRDFHRIVTLKHKLATDDLSAEQRAKAQAEYNDLLNKYFEVR